MISSTYSELFIIIIIIIIVVVVIIIIIIIIVIISSCGSDCGLAYVNVDTNVLEIGAAFGKRESLLNHNIIILKFIIRR